MDKKQACLFKAPKRKGARVVLEVFTEDGKMSKPCTVLTAVRAENQRLNVSVTKKIGFKLGGDDAGDAVVHVTGYGYNLIDGDADFSPEDEEMELEDDEMEASDESSDSADSDEEVMEEAEVPRKRIMKKEEAEKVKSVEPPSVSKQPSKPPSKPQSQFKTHKTGLKLQDLLVGSGKAVKNGRNVGVEYVLRLESGKVVDKTRKKQPFKFRLGIGECIKGFDIGIAGK